MSPVWTRAMAELYPCGKRIQAPFHDYPPPNMPFGLQFPGRRNGSHGGDCGRTDRFANKVRRLASAFDPGPSHDDASSPWYPLVRESSIECLGRRGWKSRAAETRQAGWTMYRWDCAPVSNPAGAQSIAMEGARSNRTLRRLIGPLALTCFVQAQKTAPRSRCWGARSIPGCWAIP